MHARHKIVFNHVSKSYGAIEVVKDLSFEILEGEALVLVRKSGCGKTTTLKMINRLIEPSRGIIEIDGKNIFSYPPIELRRTIGYVIQSVGLFPHMTVGRNIGIVPELLGWPRNKIVSRIDELFHVVGLDPDNLRDRFPLELSGGQQQRIGVARALAADPPIILMDEPFGALDPITREELQDEFLNIIKRIKKTIVFVTHDIFEAVKIADKIALMDKGEIVQIGKTRELVENPCNQFVMNFLGGHLFQLSLIMMKLDSLLNAIKLEKVDEVSRKDLPSIQKDLPSIQTDATIMEALNCFKQNKTQSILVHNQDGTIKGILKKGSLNKRILNML